MKKIAVSALLACAIVASGHAIALEPFRVTKIRVEGLQRISDAAVTENLPVVVGDMVDDEKSAEIVRAVFRTGFFKDVQVFNQDGVLVIQVEERPSIGELIIKGTKDKDKLAKNLKAIGLAEGMIFDPQLLKKAEKEIEKFYFSKGKYGVRIDTKTREESRNRVAVELDIYEGDEARISEVHFVGNQKFDEKTLQKQLQYLRKSNVLSWFTKDDIYAKEKLQADLENVRSFYMDRGYINFQVDSTQVSLTPDKKHIYINVKITEGEPYHVSGVELSGLSDEQQAKLKPLLSPIKKGDVFSRKKLISVKEALEAKLGEEGFSAVEVRPIPEVDPDTKTIGINFHVDPKRRMYVRRVEIIGNTTTQDEVLRREIPQLEGTWVSSGAIKEGKQNIMRRMYASQVEIETPLVPGTQDQVDVIYKVQEAQINRIEASIGYSPTEKFLIRLSASQQNFLGTGKLVDFTFDNSRAFTTYNFSYQDPYFTIDGVGFGFNVFYSETDLSKTTDVSNYASDAFGGSVYWIFPISKFDYFKVGGGLENANLKAQNGPLPLEIEAFFAQNGQHYNDLYLMVGWGENTLDQGVFPHSGINQNLGLRVVTPGAKNPYYRLTYDMVWYYPLSEQFILAFNTTLGFGDGYGKSNTLPFYKNFYAGGSETVRGFEEDSLGPKDSQGRAFGGNALAAGTMSVIFPAPFLSEVKSVRTALFFDVGQVYDTRDKHRIVNGESVSRNPAGVRYSVGVSVSWHSPFGMMTFSLAKPLNFKEGDKKRPFMFTMGSSI